MMHAARLDRSARLQRVLAVLEDGREHTTRDLVVAARVCAVNSCIAELRANGHAIACRQAPGDEGRVWLYRLVRREPPSGGPRGDAAAAGSAVPHPGPGGPPAGVRRPLLMAAGGATYRYILRREVAPLVGEGLCVWVMLNPSTATDDVDDPTIRKCAGFTKRWGDAALEVVNLYAFRSTDPRVLRGLPREVAIGPGNDTCIRQAVRRATRLVLAWGHHGSLQGRGEAVSRLIRAERQRVLRVPASACALPECLGLTGNGQPRHPLMVAYAAERSVYGSAS